MSVKIQTPEVPPDSPETPWIRTSERLTLATCPWAWDMSYIQRIKPNYSKSALRFGSLIHLALEEFYKPGGLKRGPIPAHTFEREYQKELKKLGKMGWYDEDGSWYEAGQLGVSMLEGYYELYGKDERWHILGVEIPFHVPVYNPRTKRLLFTYVGVIDVVARDRGMAKSPTVIIDHKTTRDDPTKKTAILVLDEQTGTYWSFGREYLENNGYIKPGTKMAGMIHNFLKKSRPGDDDDRPRNSKGLYLNKPKKEVLVAKFHEVLKRPPGRGENNVDVLSQLLALEGVDVDQLGEVSKKQPGPTFHRELTYRYEYDSQMVKNRIMAQFRLMRMFRSGELAIYKTPGTLHNPHCGYCDYRDICELHEQGGNWEELRDATMTKWEPYSQHEIDAGEKK